MNAVPQPTFKVPFGVTLVAALFLLSSFLTCGVLVLGLLEPGWVFSLHYVRADIENARNHVVAHLFVAGMYAAVGCGLWRLQRWARLAVLFVAGASFITALAGIILGTVIKPLIHQPVAAFFWFSAVISGVIITYFRQSQVKTAFRRRAAN